MGKRNKGKGSWKELSWTWSIAKAVVDALTRLTGFFTGKKVKVTAPTKAIRKVQLTIVYPLTVAYTIMLVLLFATLANELKDTECTFVPCNCSFGYDIWGNENESPYPETYHCTTHGHDCPEND